MYLNKMLEIDREIAELERKRDVLLNSKEKWEDLPKNKKLAIELHKLFCRHNHTDGCGWYYDADEYGIPKNWGKNSAAGRWLNKASSVLGAAPENISYEVLLDILEKAVK